MKKKSKQSGDLEKNANKNIAKGGFIIFISIILSTVSFFVYKIIVARYLGPSQYGTFTLGITILNVITMIGLAGIHLSIGKFLNEYLAKKKYAHAKGLVYISFLLTATLSILIGIVTYTLSNFLGKNIFEIPQLASILRILSIGVFFSVQARLIKYYFYALKKPQLSIISESLCEKLLNIVFILGIIVYTASLQMLTITFVSSLIIATIVGSLLLLPQIKRIILKKVKPKVQMNQIVSFSIPLMITAILGSALAWTDTLFIGYFKTETDVGIYNIAYIFSSLLMIVWFSFGDIFYPIASELFAKKAYSQIRKSFITVSRWMLMLIVPMFLAILTYPKRFISIVFGSEYITASAPLSILIIGYFLLSIWGLAEQGLRTFKKTTFLGCTTFIGFCVNVILNITLIPKLGITGAAIATTVSLTLIAFTRLVYFKKLTKTPSEIKNSLKLILAAAIALTTMHALKSVVQTNQAFMFIALMVFYVAVYAALLVAMQSFTKEDIQLFNQIKYKILRR